MQVEDVTETDNTTVTEENHDETNLDIGPNDIRLDNTSKPPDNSSTPSENTSKPPDRTTEVHLFSKLLLAVCGETKYDISIHRFMAHLKQSGLRPMSDNRLRAMVTTLLVNTAGSGENLYSEYNLRRTYPAFELSRTMSPECMEVIQKALIGKLVIPEFKRFTEDLARMVHRTKDINEGENASYIPQIARKSRSIYSVSVCTVDGQRWTGGQETSENVTVQSFSAALNYAIALTQLGSTEVHKYVGCEPCDRTDMISLDKKNLPHNPLVQSGALAIASLLLLSRPDLPSCCNEVLGIYKALAGTPKLQINNAIYIAEKGLSDRKFSIGYFMKEHEVFPAKVKLKSVLELYFQLCSVELGTDDGAVIAASLANGGICPLTNDQVLSETSVKHLLSVMHLSGMYSYSGEWMFEIGLPAKSSRSGMVMVVIPNVMGICVYSPPLDPHGNSVRAVELIRLLTQKYSLHFMDNHISAPLSKENLVDRREGRETREQIVMNIMYAAVHGDVTLLQRYRETGVSLEVADYDGRTALHLAACSDNLTVVQFLLDCKVDVNALDRWNRTPLNDAEAYSSEDLVSLLKSHNASVGPGLVEVA